VRLAAPPGVGRIPPRGGGPTDRRPIRSLAITAMECGYPSLLHAIVMDRRPAVGDRCWAFVALQSIAEARILWLAGIAVFRSPEGPAAVAIW